MSNVERVAHSDEPTPDSAFPSAGEHNGACKEPDIPLRSWWRPKQLKESECWTYVHQADTNTTPNEC